RGPGAASDVAMILAGVGAGVTALLAIGLRVVVRGGRQTALLVRVLGWLPVARMRRWLVRSVDRFRAMDMGAGRFFQAPLPVRARCFATFLLEWLVEGLETFLILRCVA